MPHCRFCITGLLALALGGCGGSDLGAGFADVPVKTAAQVSNGRSGVSSAHPLASQAGRELLAMGGNAVDAAVATSFALAVVENSMNGLGGRVQILMRDADGSMHGIDAQTELGADYQGPWLIPAFSGVEIVGVPGLVAGLLKLHDEHGSRPLEEVMAPAIRYARKGYPILPGEVTRHLRVEETVRADPVMAEIFLHESGAVHRAGQTFRQRDLADTLQVIATGGVDAFYRGDIAQRMADDLQARGGSVRYEDLATYEAKDATIVSTTYRGHEIVGTTSPANGTAVIAALNVLGHFGMSEINDVTWARIISQTMAQTMQATMMDDPDGANYKLTIGADRVQAYLKEIEPPGADSARVGPRRRFVLPQEQSAGMQVSQVDWSGRGNGEFSHHTTHHVAADHNGMVVTMTQTLGPNFGAKVMTPGLGFVYAQTGGMPRWIADTKPGDRPMTNIAPVIVLRDGQPVLALGAAGGLMIPPAIVQVISRVIDQGYSLEEAVAAPRIAPTMNFLPPGFAMDEAILEMTPINGWTEADAAALHKAGIEISGREMYSLLARVHAIGRDLDTGIWTGIADPDWEGSASMVE